MIPKIIIFGSFYYVVFLNYFTRTQIKPDRFICVAVDVAKKKEPFISLEVPRVKKVKIPESEA